MASVGKFLVIPCNTESQINVGSLRGETSVPLKISENLAICKTLASFSNTVALIFRYFLTIFFLNKKKNCGATRA